MSHAEPMDRHAILAEVRRRGSSFAEIALKSGLKRQTLYWATIQPHPRANRAIGEFLGVPLHALWPRWFDEAGKLISRERAPRPAFGPGRQALALRRVAVRKQRRAA